MRACAPLPHNTPWHKCSLRSPESCPRLQALPRIHAALLHLLTLPASPELRLCLRAAPPPATPRALHHHRIACLTSSPQHLQPYHPRGAITRLPLPHPFPSPIPHPPPARSPSTSPARSPSTNRCYSTPPTPGNTQHPPLATHNETGQGGTIGRLSKAGAAGREGDQVLALAHREAEGSGAAHVAGVTRACQQETEKQGQQQGQARAAGLGCGCLPAVRLSTGQAAPPQTAPQARRAGYSWPRRTAASRSSAVICPGSRCVFLLNIESAAAWGAPRTTRSSSGVGKARQLGWAGRGLIRRQAGCRPGAAQPQPATGPPRRAGSAVALA